MVGKKRAGGGTKAFMKSVMSRGEAKETAEPVPSFDASESGATVQNTDTITSRPVKACPEVKATLESVEDSSNSQDAAPTHRTDGTTDMESKAPETKGQMQQRHKKELKSLKEAMKKLGKKRKDEVEKLESDTTTRHAAEVAAFQAVAVPVQLTEVSSLISACNGTGRGASPTKAEVVPKESSRAQKRRAKEAQKQADRDVRIAEEQASLGDSKRKQEEEALALQLLPQGLVLQDIPPDGNCLYRAVEAQLHESSRMGDSGISSSSHGVANGTDGKSLTAVPSVSDHWDHKELRAAAVDYIRQHEAEFVPYVLPETQGDAGEGEEGASEQFQQYCDSMADEAVWGGQIELSALTHVLQRPIRVFSVGMPPVLMGNEYQELGPPLQVSFQRHAYELGEHYNSVVPGPSSKAEEADSDKLSSDWSTKMQLGH